MRRYVCRQGGAQSFSQPKNQFAHGFEDIADAIAE
jgi:hypothetical protein